MWLDTSISFDFHLSKAHSSNDCLTSSVAKTVPGFMRLSAAAQALDAQSSCKMHSYRVNCNQMPKASV
jgi:hypothetical protein